MIPPPLAPFADRVAFRDQRHRRRDEGAHIRRKKLHGSDGRSGKETLRDHFKCANALFLDGTISSLYTIEPKIHLIRFPLGPIVGIVAPVE